MAFRVSRQKMFYAEATLSASAAIGFGILRVQDYGLKHPHALEVWIAICVVTAIVCAIVGSMSNEDSSAPKATNTTQTTDGDNSPVGGSGTTAGRDIKQITAEHYHEAATSGPPSQPDRQQPALKHNRKPNLDALSVEEIRARETELHWVRASGGIILHVLPIENVVGDHNAKAESICASLKFTSSMSSASTRIQKAFWLNHQGNEIDIPLSHTRAHRARSLRPRHVVLLRKSSSVSPDVCRPSIR
jgi:hypothetical protein